MGTEGTSSIRRFYERAARLFADCAQAVREWWLTVRGTDPRFHFVRCPPDAPGETRPEELGPSLEKLQQQFRQDLERLDPDQRNILLLHTQEGFTYHEIAAQTGLSEDFVLKQLTTAYGQLRIWQIERDAEAESAAKPAADDDPEHP